MSLPRLAPLALAAIAVLPPATASATTGLVWQLDEQPARYFIHTHVQLPQIMWWLGRQNLETRITEFETWLVTSCARRADVGKKAWELECTIDDIAIHGAPVSSDEGRALPVLREWDEALTGATVTVQFKRDGRVRDVGLGVEVNDERSIAMAESMRLVLVRAFAGLDFQLPSDGDDKDKGAWRQRETLVMGFVSDRGTLGAAEVRHTLTSVESDVATISTSARGTLGSGEMITIAGQERPANMFEMTVTGEARFDTARGLLLGRDYECMGTMTASSVDASGRAGFPYYQKNHLEFVDQGLEAPHVGETMELVREDNLPTTTSGVSNPQ